MSQLAKVTLILTLGYFIMWGAGPILFNDQLTFYYLPLWFWFSIIAAPISLVVVLFILFKKKVL